MNRKMHFVCCCTLLFIFSVLHNIAYISDFGNIRGGYSFLWFSILYIVAAYFRKYVPEKVKKQNSMFFIYIIASLSICGERFVAYYVTPYIFGQVQLTSLFYSYNSIMMVIASLALFQFFRGIEIHQEKLNELIEYITPLTFAVYLIHEQDDLRMLIWNALHPCDHYDKPWLIIYVVLCVIIVFFLSCFIEWIRMKISRLTGISHLMSSICRDLQCKLESLFENIDHNMRSV